MCINNAAEKQDSDNCCGKEIAKLRSSPVCRTESSPIWELRGTWYVPVVAVQALRKVFVQQEKRASMSSMCEIWLC